MSLYQKHCKSKNQMRRIFEIKLKEMKIKYIGILQDIKKLWITLMNRFTFCINLVL